MGVPLSHPVQNLSRLYFGHTGKGCPQPFVYEQVRDGHSGDDQAGDVGHAADAAMLLMLLTLAMLLMLLTCPAIASGVGDYANRTG